MVISSGVAARSGITELWKILSRLINNRILNLIHVARLGRRERAGHVLDPSLGLLNKRPLALPHNFGGLWLSADHVRVQLLMSLLIHGAYLVGLRLGQHRLPLHLLHVLLRSCEGTASLLDLLMLGERAPFREGHGLGCRRGASLVHHVLLVDVYLIVVLELLLGPPIIGSDVGRLNL